MRSSLLLVVLVAAGCQTYALHRAALVPHQTPLPIDGQPRKDMGIMIRYWRLSNSAFSLSYDGTGIRGQEAIAVGKDRITITGSITANGVSTPYVDIWDRVK